MATNIHTVEARAKLPARRSAYWHTLSGGCQLGFRKLTPTSTGNWFVQINLEGTGQDRTPLGKFDHLPPRERFDAAKRAAEAHFLHLTQGGSSEDTSVKAACETYVKHLRAEGKSATATDAEGRFERRVYSSKLAGISLRKLTAVQLREWRNALVAAPVVVNPHSEEHVKRKRSPASVNREMTTLKAALNFAQRHGAVQSDAAWRVALQPMEGASNRRTTVLDRNQRAAMIDAAEPSLGLFLRGMSALPLRPGALAALKVGQFDARLGMLTVGKDKAGNRTIPVAPKTAKFFAELTGQRPADAPLFTREEGKAWNKDAWKGPVKAAALAAELSPQVTAYTLRHSVITDLIVAGLDTLTVARLAGTSLVMIEKHYGHLKAKHASAALELVAI